LSDSHNGAALRPLQLVTTIMQIIAKWLLIALAVSAVIATVLAANGTLAWLDLSTTAADGTSSQVGPMIQIAVTLCLVALVAFLPTVNRVMALENSQREKYAYIASHSADRASQFKLSDEYDDIRARIEYMRDHPDLATLEPELLELAAQMSHASRDIAKIYSDEKVRRAKAFLAERQHEVADFQDKLELAMSVTAELKRWRYDIDASETEAERQMDRLEKDLKEILPTIGYELDDDVLEGDVAQDNVVALDRTGDAKA